MATSVPSPLKFVPDKKQYKLGSFDKVVYDEARQQLLLFKGNRFSYLSIKKSRTVHTRQISEQPNVIAAACSVDQRFIARQISPTQVEVFDFYTHETNTITCRSASKRRAMKVGKTLLADDQHHLRENGLIWCKFEDLKHALVLVTGLAIEIYTVHSNANSRRKSFVSFKRSLAHLIKSVCYYPFEDRGVWQGVLVLCTGTAGTQCQPYLVNSAKPQPLQKFEVSRAVTSMRLVSLYQSMYLICIESGTTVHKAPTQHCLVYRVRRRHDVQVVKKYALAPGPVDILATDNLLCILYWRDFHCTVLDIKAPGHREVVNKWSCRLAPPPPSTTPPITRQDEVQELTVELPCTSSLGLKLKSIRGFTADSPSKTRKFCVVDGFHRVGDQDPAQLDRLSKAEGADSYLGMLPAEECGMIERGQHLVAVNGQSVLDMDFKEALQLVKQQFQTGADTERCSIRLTFRTRLPDGFQRLRFVNNGIVATGSSANSMPFRSLWPSWVLHKSKGMLMQLKVDLGAIVHLKRMDACMTVSVLQRRQIAFCLTSSPWLSLSPNKAVSPNARPPLSKGKQSSELDIQQLITGAMRMWIADRELDQVEARKLFNKLNAALRNYMISRKEKKPGVTRAKEKRQSFTREKRNLSFSNMTTDLAVPEPATNSEEESAETSANPRPEVARNLDRAGERRTEDGLLVLTVDDMFRYVFYPAAQASAVIARSPRRRARYSLRQTAPDDSDTAQDNVMSFLLKEYPPPKQMPSYAVVKSRLITQFGEETFAQKKHLVQSLLHSRAQQSPEILRDDDAESGEDADTLWSDSTAAAAATKETRVQAHYLVSLVLEYIASLQAVKLMPSTNLCLLLVTLLVKIERYDQLLQLIQYHILPDSPDMAKRLLSLALRLCARYSDVGERDAAMALRQVALDMLYRLKDIDTLTKVLLRRSGKAGDDGEGKGESFAAYRTALAARWQFNFMPTPKRVRRFAKAAILEALQLQSQEEELDSTGEDQASRQKAIADIAVQPLLQLFRFLSRWARASSVSEAVWTSACEHLRTNLPKNLWLKVETLFTLGPLS